MAKIKFSHNYLKMPIQTECAKLLQIFIVDKNELSRTFIKYDTQYMENGCPKEYPLPNGKLIVLLFDDEDNNCIFTTIRRWTQQKEEYYRSLIDKYLDVEVSAHSSQD